MGKLKEDFSIELAIVMEPSSLECQLGCNGTLNATLIIPGVSSHSARPWMGENPFFKLKEITEFLSENEIKDYEIDGLIYKQVITVTRINGGVANNVTPPNITLNINFRFVPSFSAEDAEKYITDATYPVGTLMAIGGEEEATAIDKADSDICIGVISSQPAYLMNSDSQGQAIALVGRVPVRITGPVNKGEAVHVAKNGTASVDGEGQLIGIALEDNDRHEETLVECILKL